MKALSLTQPWASLVAHGFKRWETRSWNTHYRGPLAIHASKGFPRYARDTCRKWTFRHALRVASFDAPDDLPLGCIVAVARISVTITTNLPPPTGHTNMEIEFGDYSPGRWAWQLDDVRRIERPIPCKGALGLWTVPPELTVLLGAETCARGGR